MRNCIYRFLKSSGNQWRAHGNHGRRLCSLTGTILADRPPLAVKKVRYYGEPIGIVVAETEQIAKRAAELVLAEFLPLPVVQSASSALLPDAPLIHEDWGATEPTEMYIPPTINIGNYVKPEKAIWKQVGGK